MSIAAIRITALIAGASMIGAAVIGSSTANATPQDDTFLALLQQDGITVTIPADVIKGAHDFCDALSQGATRAQLIQDLIGTGKFNRTDAIHILNASIAVYCPDEVTAQ
jgi:uncharacterized protein DUF732